MKKCTEVILVRHGQTKAIADGKIQSQTDSPLSEQGRLDAQKTADHFAGQYFDVIYTSSLGRAIETARIIGEKVNFEPVLIDGLREQHYGWLEGMPITLFEPEGGGHWLFRAFVRFAMAHTAEKGSDYLNRVLAAFEKIVSVNQGKRIMLVVHWGIICILERYLSGEDVHQWFRQVEWNYCGISEFHQKLAGWEKIRLDDCSHL